MKEYVSQVARILAYILAAGFVGYLVWYVLDVLTHLDYHRRLYGVRAYWFQRRKRNEPLIKLWVGKRRRGKSLSLTYELQRELEHGTAVLSNYPVYDPRSDRVAELWTTTEQLVARVAELVVADCPRIIIGISEAQNVFDARKWEATEEWFKQFLSECGHFHVGIYADTQALEMVEKRFRQMCDDVIRVRPLLDGFLHRFAVLRVVRLEEDFDSVDSEAREVGVATLRYIPARAFAGYSTAALPDEASFAVKRTPDQEAAIAALIAATRRHVSQDADRAAQREAGGPGLDDPDM